MGFSSSIAIGTKRDASGLRPSQQDGQNGLQPKAAGQLHRSEKVFFLWGRKREPGASPPPHFSDWRRRFSALRAQSRSLPLYVLPIWVPFVMPMVSGT